MSRSQTGCESSTGFADWGRSHIATNLEHIGIKKRWQETVYSTLAGRIGLGGQAYVPHPDYEKQWDLGYNRNLFHACAALVVWVFFVWFVSFQLFHATCDLHNLTTCITSQRTQTKPWDETVGSSSAVVYMRSWHKHLSLNLSTCLITNGNYAGYKENRAANRIDPVEGGCTSPEVVNLSSEQALNTLVADGGCKLFESDNAYKYGWCQRVSSPVVGQYGDPAFRFLKIDVVANTQEMFAAGNSSNLDFIYPEFVGGKKDDYNSVYYTFDPFYPMKKEMFFQRSEIVKHSSLEFLSSKEPEAARTYLHYHHEYNRWERSNTGGSGQIWSGLLAKEHLIVATIYLRATSSRILYDERQVKTLYDFPKDAGGFWTASLFLGALGYLLLKLIFPRKVADFSDLLQREQQKHLRRAMNAKAVLEAADGEFSFAVSQPPSDFACGKPVFAEKEQSIELLDAACWTRSTGIPTASIASCQDLEKPVTPRVHVKDDEENGDQPGTELPKRLVL